MRENEIKMKNDKQNKLKNQIEHHDTLLRLVPDMLRCNSDQKSSYGSDIPMIVPKKMRERVSKEKEIEIQKLKFKNPIFVCHISEMSSTFIHNWFGSIYIPHSINLESIPI